MSHAPNLIVIDGPAGSGKGSLAKALARHFYLDHLDTGLLFRAVALKALAENETKDPTKLMLHCESLTLKDLTSPLLRQEHVGQCASVISQYPELREALLVWQRTYVQKPTPKRGYVLDGRDLGTVVFKNAPVKFFLTASLEARAQRRYQELQRQEKNVIYAHVLHDMRERDTRDKNRTWGPCRHADDAFIVDTTFLSLEKVLEKVCAIIQHRLPLLKGGGDFKERNLTNHDNTSNKP